MDKMIAHIEIGPQRRPWAGSFLKRCISILLSAVLFMQPVLVNAQSVSASATAPGSNQPGIGAAPNGVPLVDIVTPNAQGLSHNKYDRFNVGESGLILNNHNGEVGTSLLGGVTPGNANLKHSGPATVILNEVTSGSRSQLLGPTEVFGGRADVIIANPNGITCDGCGFINTPRTTLTTGTPDIGADGRLNGVTVRDGDVTIGAKGGNFAAGQGAVDLFDIVSRSVRIDGPVHARDLRLTAGRNKVGYASGDITPLEATTGTPEFAIDGSALGAMQADRIKIVVTEKGAGVRMRGNMAANVGELSLSADGKISIGNASGADGVKLNSKAKIEAGKVTSKKRVVAKADRGITLQSVAADSELELTSGLGLLSVAGDASALGSITLNSSGGISVDNLDARDTLSVRSDAGDIGVRGSAKAGGDIIVSAASGALSAGSLVSFRNLTLHAGLDIGVSGELLAQGNISAAGRNIRSSTVVSGIDLNASRAGKTVLGGTGNLTFSANETIESASLLAAGHLDATANLLKLGEVRGHGAVRIAGDVNARSQILGAGDVLIDGRTIVADTIASGVNFAASTQPGAGITHGASGILSLLANTGNVNVRSLSSAGQLVVTAGELSSQGISARGAIDIKGNVTVGGQILGASDIVVSGKRIAVDTLVSGVDFAGTSAGGRIALTDRGSITINAASGEIRGGTMLAAGTLKATAGQIAAKELSSRSSIDLSGEVAVTGRISGAGNVHIDGRTIAATSIAAGSASKLADLSLVARDGSIKADMFESTGQLTVDAAQLEARTIAGRSNVDVMSGNGTVGQLFAGKNLGISGGNFTIETLIAGLDFGRTDAAGGKALLAGDGGITINAASGTVRATTLLSAASLSATVGGLVAGTVKVHGNIELSGNADVSKEILASGNIAVSGNTIKAGTVASGVDFAATDAAGGVLSLRRTGDLTLSARDNVTADTVLGAGRIQIDTSRFDARAMTGQGDVRIHGNTVVRERLLAAGNIDVLGDYLSAGTLVSGVDLARTRAGNGDVVLGPQGMISIVATAGNVAAGTLLSAGDLVVSAAKVAVSKITSRKNVSLAGEVESDQVLGAGDVRISGRNIKATTIASGVDFVATENSSSGAIALSDRGNLTIDAASGKVEAGAILSAGNFTSISNALTARRVSAHGVVSIDGSTVIDGSLLAKGNVIIRGGSVSAGAIVSGVDFAATRLSPSGNVVLGTDGVLTVTATSGSVTAGALLSAGDLSATGAKITAGEITGRRDLRLIGEVETNHLLAGRDITVGGNRIKAGSIASGVDFAATDAGRGGIALSNRGNLTIDAASGSVEVDSVLTAGGFTSRSGTLAATSITSHGAVSIDGSTVIDGSLLGQGNVTIRGGSIRAGAIASGVDFTATKRSASGNIVLGSDGMLTLDASSGQVTAGTLLSAGDLVATAGRIVASNINGRKDIRLAGEIETRQILGGRDIVIGGGLKATSIASGVDFAATETGNGSIALSNRGNLTIDTATGNVDAGTVLSAGAFDSRSKTFAARSVTAHGAVSIDGTTTIDGSLLGKGGVTVRGASVTAGAIAAGVDFEATKRSASGNIVLGADGALTVTATSGNVTAGTLLSAGDMSLTAMKIAASNITGRMDIRLTGETEANQVLGGRDITIAGAKVTTTSIASGVDFAATEAGGGSIVLSDRGKLTIEAASGAVKAGTVLTAGALDSKSTSFAARSVTANGAVSIDGATAIDGSLLSQGDVTIRGGAITAGAIVSGVDFAATKGSASGNIVVGSEGALTLTATSGNVTAGTLLSAGDLTAAARKIAVANITGRKAIGLAGEVETNQILGGANIAISGGRLKASSIASGVDFAATEAGNGSIALSSGGNLTIDAGSASVEAGTVLTAGSFSSKSGSFAAKSVTAHGAVSIDGTTAIDGSLLSQGNVGIRGSSINAGAIVSGVDFAAIKRSGSGNIVLANDGAMTLTALSGDVTTGVLLSAGDLDVSASKIAATNITGRKDIRLTGEAEANQILGGRDITITGSNVKAGSIAAGVDFAATGTGAIALAGRGNLTIQAASGSVDAGTVLTAGSLDSKSGSFAARSVTANGPVSIEGSAAIDGSLLSQGSVTIRGTSIRAGAIVSGVDFAATRRSASGNIVLGADGALTLVATSGNVSSGSLLSAGDLAATASKIAVTNITGRKDIRLTGETEASQILGGRDIAITGNRVKATAIAAGVDFAATEAGRGAIALSDRGNLTINAVAGPVETGSILTAGNFTSSSGSFAAKSVTTHGAVSIEGSTAIDGSLLARNAITVRGGSISAGAIVSGIDFDATKRSAAGNIVLGGGGALTLVATSGNVTSGSLLSAGDLVATGSKVAAANITGRNDIRLTGELDSNQILGGRDVAITGNRVNATAIAAGVDFAATETGNGAIALSNRGNLTINAIAGPVETGAILTAGDFTSSSATFAANSVTAHGAVSIDGSTVIGGSLLARNAVSIRGGSISAGAIVSGVDFAATKRSLSGNIVLGADGALTLAATAGNVTAGTLLSAGDLTVAAANSVSAQATSRRNLTVDANGSIRLTGQTLAGSDISLRADAVTVDTLVSGVDFAATEASLNGTLALKGQGKLTLTASSAEVTASSLVSAGQMDVSANRNVSYGSLQSFNSARLASANGSISLDRTTRSAGDMTLVARSVDLSGNRGRIATGGTLAITADNASFAGSSYTFGGLDLRLVGRADFSGASINAVRRSGGSGDMKIVASGIDQNAATILLAERDIALTLARLDNAGQIAAGRDLSVSAGNASNGPTGLIYAGNDINLLVGGDILNDRGAIMAGGDLTIAGAAADRNGASLTNISGLIQAGSDVSIRTDRLINKRIANPTFTRDVVVASDVKTGFELNPDVAGKPYAFLFGRSSDGRELYAGIGPQYWADYEPQLWSQAKTADGGSYRAWTWISGNGPKWVGEISRWIRDRVPRDSNGVPIYGSDNPSRHFIVQYVNPGADSSTTYSWDFDANISQTIQEDRIVDAGSPQAMIRAGRNLDVTATNLTNSYSAIEADGNATLKGMAFSNEGLALNRTVQTTCNARGACEAYDANGNRDPSRDIAAGTSIVSKVETTGVEAGTVKAGGHLDISGFATFSNTAADRSLAGSANLAPTTKSGDPLAALAGLTAGGALFTPNAALLGVAQGSGLTAGSGPLAAIATVTAAAGPSATTTTLTAGGGLAAPTTTLAGERTTVAAGPALTANGSSVSATSGLSADGGRVGTGAAPSVTSGGVANGPATAVASGNVSGAGPSSTTGTTVVAAVQPNTLGATIPVVGALSGNLKEAPQVDVDRLASLAKPESGGFGGTIPGQVFLFETRAAFLDVGKFYGSGYYLDRVGYEPDTRVPFLGDAYFENQLIDRQVRQQTGHGLGGTFDPGKDSIEEMKLLLDNGIAYAKENKLSIGERLSPEQIARLTQSIVLYEKQVVQGVEVLAPVVYLANTDKAKLTAAGALVAGNSVNMDIGKLSNSGAIAAKTDLTIKATDIKVDGGSIKAGGNVQLASTGDLTFTAQSLDIGGMNVVNPNAAIVAGGNATLLANDGLKLQGATIDVSGNVGLSANTITLDALKVDNGGSQNVTGSAIKAGGNLTIAGNSDVSIIGSGTKAGKDLTITSQGSVNVVSTDVTGKTDDGYKTLIAKRQQEGQLVSGGSTTVKAGSDILISGSSIRSGSDVTLKAADDISITAAQETTSERFGKSHVSTERHQSSEVKAGGSITASAGEGTGDHDLNIVGSKLEAKERVALKAEGDLTIAEARNSETGNYIWDGGGDKTKSHEAAQTSVGSSVSGGGGVSTRSGGDTLVSASTLEAGAKDRKADLTVSAGGDLVVTSGKDTYEKHAQSERKGFLSKTSASEDRQHETTVASELGASGNITLNAGDNVAIAGSNIDAGQSVTIEGDNVAILGAEEKHADAEQKKKSGLFAGSGDGFISLWGKEQKDSRKTSTENVGSAITAGEDVTVKAREGDVAVIGSAIEAERDIRLEAVRDVNITPGAESSSSEEKEKRSGFGIAYSSGNGGASIGIGYGSKKDEVRQSAETNSSSHLSAGRDVTINAGRDANLQAAKVEAERDVAIKAQRDVNLLSAQDRSNYEEVHEQLFAGVTLSVSSSLVSAGQSVGEAAEQVASGSGTYSVANAAFAGLQAYKALKDLSEISKTGEVGLSASLTAGFSYSKNSSKAESSVPVVSAVRAGQSVAIDAVSGDINGRGAQIVAGRDALGLPNLSGSETAGDITLKAGKDINLESAVATSSSSQKNSGVSAGVGIGGSIGIGPAGVSDNLGLMAFAGGSKGSSTDNATAHVNSHVMGTGDVTLMSGNDTSLKGATVTGKSVTADVGGDLKIESQVDTTTAKVKQTSGGITISSTGFEASGSKQKASGDVAVVNEQSGIHAGTGGFDIDVEGTTSLKGGLVTSDATAEKNRIETGKLEWEDVDTHSKWKAESYGGSIGSGGATMAPPQKAGESETGKALTAVSPGTIVITDPSGQTQNLDDLRRDTANTNTSLPGLPDLQNILQQQYNTQAAYQEASAIMAGLVGDVADKLAREAMARGDAKAAEMWGAGGVGRAALHAVGGGLLGGVNDVSGMVKGAFGGATSVLIAPYVDQLVKGLVNDTNLAGTPAGQSLANIISSGLVMGLTGVVGGGDAAAYAGAEFQYNYLTHKAIEEFASKLKKCGNDTDCQQDLVVDYVTLSRANDEALIACETATCRAAHLEAIGRAKGLGDTVLNPFLYADPVIVAELRTLQSPDRISASMHLSMQREKAIAEAREDCGVDTVCINRVANERYDSWLASQEAKQMIAGVVLGTAGTSLGRKPIAVSDFDASNIAATVSLQRQNRHVKGRPEWDGRQQGGYFNSVDDAQKVLDAVKNGGAKFLGTNSQGQPIYRFSGVTGYNNNPGYGYLDQPTNVFVIKGTAKPSIVPTNPNWGVR